ncbi:glucoamylase family protein [Salinisphaera sp. SPP-AMP-43]|uniref:GH36-type glycosyl hydrolase domain-containing protein n=1 Tax=Salinisphaera sp. SPP-AMP-43 TaxID=3121288 RepID=UPI003C6E9DCA
MKPALKSRDRSSTAAPHAAQTTSETGVEIEWISNLAQAHQRLLRSRAAPAVSRLITLIEVGYQRLYERIGHRVSRGQRGSRTEEWLLDNWHIVQRAIEQVRESLPPGYLVQLPQIRGAAGRPELRVRELAVELIAQGGEPVDVDHIVDYVNIYQQVCVLNIGEVWALPAVLRWVLLERLLAVAEQGVSDEPATDDSRPSGMGVASLVLSLRTLEDNDWREIAESLLIVDTLLRQDPAGAYEGMDFASRDRYRKAVERHARRAAVAEIEIVRVALQCAQAATTDRYRRHVGFYLIDEGRVELAGRIGQRLHRPWYELPHRWASLLYFLGLAIFAMPLWLALGVFVAGHGAAWPIMTLVMLLTTVMMGGLASGLLNGLITHMLPPYCLPKLDFDAGIPERCRSAVAVPCLLSQIDDIAPLLERLEINYLNNADPNLVYVLLGDFADAPNYDHAEDAAILETTRARLEALNERYRDTANNRGPFVFLHRRREWNTAQNCWMGWERKRGKLLQFNRLITGNGRQNFETLAGDRTRLQAIRYVITLDADTAMPQGTARLLVGTMAHPLNQAIVDTQRMRVQRGYAFLQPRLDSDPSAVEPTRFTQIFDSDPTVDLYTNAVSNAYQDLFGEGIFAGKGIYDPHVIGATLNERLPANRLLSHDLLEGSFGRTALVSDTRFYEQFPPSIFVYLRRSHRWIRGDWQLLPWLWRWVPLAEGRREPNPLTLIQQWQILDNLRRSMTAPATLALLCVVWAGLLPGAAWAWTLGLVGLSAAPIWVELLTQLWRCAADWRRAPRYLQSIPRRLWARAGRWLLSLCVLPYESLFVIDGVVRTLYRMRVSRRHLLDWRTAHEVHRDFSGTLTWTAAWREMWISPAFAVGVVLWLGLFAPAALLPAGPFVLAWLVAPMLAHYVSRAPPVAAPQLRAAERRLLRDISRRTWFFFERFMGPDDHWMPPDNYQEEPKVVLARRTSPTNIGMGMLAVLSAHDFGYIDLFSLVARLSNSFDRLARLQQHRGHLLNWYETRELTPLAPRYVSTVDSGNFAACLITLARGLEQLPSQPIEPWRLLLGVRDTLSVLETTLRAADPARPGDAEIGWIAKLRARREAIEAGGTDAYGWALLKRFCEQDIPALRAELLALVQHRSVHLSTERLGQLHQWLDELRRQATLARHFGDQLLPWRRLLADPPDLYAGRGTARQPLVHGFEAIRSCLEQPMTLDNGTTICRDAQALVERLETELEAADCTASARSRASTWNRQLQRALQDAMHATETLCRDIAAIAHAADHWVAGMDFAFLYEPSRHLFRIGYSVDEARLDSGFYDLLASEARLTSFVAIAKGDVPSRHWLYLGRPFRKIDGRTVLMSWGATLFEYLMPTLLMPAPGASLVGRACRSAIEAQMAYSRRLQLPWGISESGYYQLDAQSNYQYRAFGIPEIGFRRDLGDRLVISAYSSVMALPFAAHAVLGNIRALERAGGLGEYGLYEAIDYGQAGRQSTRRARVVRSYMSHHQGMLLLAIGNMLNDDPMPKRFQQDARIARLGNLLHERPPELAPALKPWPETQLPQPFIAAVALPVWSPETPLLGQSYNLLSNGHLSLIQSSQGSGGSQWEGRALTRWAPDATRESLGRWCYLKDLDRDRLVSVGGEPEGSVTGQRRTLFAPHYVEHQCRALELFARLRITIACEHDVEIRHLRIQNESGHRRRLLIADYAEVALAPPAEDARHPAFAKLFVQSRYQADRQFMLFRRRPRGPHEKPLYLGHAVVVAPGRHRAVQWETDRERFLGRLGRIDRPRALTATGLSGFTHSVGTVLDPVLGCGVELTLGPHADTEIVFVTGVGHSRRAVRSALHGYRGLSRIQWAFDQGRMAAEQELSDLHIDPPDVVWMMQLLSLLLAPVRSLRAADDVLRGVERIQSALWGRGISGDLPILMVRLAVDAGFDFASRLLQAHTLWARRGRAIDLVFVDDSPGGYVQPMRDRLQQAIAEAGSRVQRSTAGQAHIVAASELSAPDRQRLWAAARVVLDSAAGPIAEQLARAASAPPTLPPFVAIGPPHERVYPTPTLSRPSDLEFDNGFGGFADDGREYVIHLDPGRRLPAPWSNVIANPEFGCITTEAGLGCTWAGNSGENRLTPWSNDPVADPASEAIYLRDEETAEVWTPTPAPRPADGAYQIRHGAGYTWYRHNSHGVEQSLRVSVDHEAPVKIVCLTLINRWPWVRRLTATYYAEWVLGPVRTATAPHIVVDYDTQAAVLLARNAFLREAEPGVAFVASSERPHGLTTDRCEFLGRNGRLEAPAALFRIGLSGRIETGQDPCAAYQVHIDLPPEASHTVYFILGQGRDREQALALAARFKAPEVAAPAQASLAAFWDRHLGSVQIRTPDRATDIMVNRWLPYQVLSCRLWGRTGYYQSSGAFGFRDQLQDVLALLWSRPEWARAHILRAASRQFAEGDVLHWWHERPLRGVRTRYSDDLLWLPYVVAQYVQATGDASILSAEVAYLSGAPLEAGEAERYTEFESGEQNGPLYEHCTRAIDHAARLGAHGLPLIGGGDWNDGFNRIGAKGRGESVWLAWFLIRVCRDVEALCRTMADYERAQRYTALADELERQAEANAWDGAWYRRAYFDDGTPLGSAKNEECQIDLMAQTWSVLALGAENPRTAQAMTAAYQRLVREETRQILLLAPPFERSRKDPGYIGGYPPGIRENGGQYTHGAVWAVWAAAALGDAARAWHLSSLLNPIRQAVDPEGVARYRTEPYVLAGDVYGVAPHAGRGGWTWYSGAAGWLFRGVLEALLGLKLCHGETLRIEPCLPADWSGYAVELRRGQTNYAIVVEQIDNRVVQNSRWVLDGEAQPGHTLTLVDDGKRHKVQVYIARDDQSSPARDT